jgi:hypothetical protein
MIRAFLFIIFFLSSCGFQVVYRERESNTEISYTDELAGIIIQKDRTALGQKMKNNLYDTINPDNISAEPKYFLTLKATKNISATYITLTGASGRNQASLTVEYELRTFETKELISTGSTVVDDNYDITLNRYGSHKAGEMVLSNLTKIAAQNIRNSLVNDLIEARRNCLSDEAFKKSNHSVCKIISK